MMIPEDATSVAKYMYRIKSIVGGDYYFVMKVLPQCFCLFDIKISSLLSALTHIYLS